MEHKELLLIDHQMHNFAIEAEICNFIEIELELEPKKINLKTWRAKSNSCRNSANKTFCESFGHPVSM
jgi:hypothetical protein